MAGEGQGTVEELLGCNEVVTVTVVGLGQMSSPVSVVVEAVGAARGRKERCRIIIIMHNNLVFTINR